MGMGLHLGLGMGSGQQAVAQETVATPAISPDAGTYATTQSVTITCATSGATIRYTTNGSDPTEASTLYKGAISVAADTTIKAKAFKSGWIASEIASAAYVIYEAEAKAYFSSIVTNGDTALTSARKTLVSELITALKAGGVFAKLDCLFIPQPTSIASRVNLISPTDTIAAAVNSPDFTADKGFSKGAGGYIDTNQNLSTADKYKFQDATMFAWMLAAEATLTSLCGSRTNATASGANANSFTNASVTTMRAPQFSASASTSQVSVIPSGFIAATLGASAAKTVLRNGVIAASYTASNIDAGYVFNGNVYYLVANTNNGATPAYTGIISVYGHGGFLTGSDNAGTATEHKALFDALNTYLTAIGALA